VVAVSLISPPPFNWVGAFGVLFIALAFLLELAHFIRQRRKVRVAFAPVKRAVPVPATATATATAAAPVTSHVVVTPAMASAVAGGTVSGNTLAGGGRGESLLDMEPPTEAIPIVAPPSTPTVAPPSTPTTGVKWPASPRRAAAARATIERADEPAFFEPVAAEPAAETGPAADLGQGRPDPAAESEPEPAAGGSAGRRPSPRPRSRTMRPSPRPRPTPYRRSNAPAADSNATESNATDTARSDELETHGNGTGPSGYGDRTAEAPVAVDAPNTAAEANRHDDTEDPEIRAAS
jgi:hypothetical protein